MSLLTDGRSETLDGIVLPDSPENIRIFADADSTLFVHNEAELYDDAERLLESVDPEKLIIVSANPNQDLRQDRLRTVDCKDIIIPNRIRFCKFGLYLEAASTVSTEGFQDTTVVIDDLRILGTLAGKIALKRLGYRDVYSWGINRNIENTNPLDSTLSIIGKIGSTTISGIKL